MQELLLDLLKLLGGSKGELKEDREEADKTAEDGENEGGPQITSLPGHRVHEVEGTAQSAQSGMRKGSQIVDPPRSLPSEDLFFNRRFELFRFAAMALAPLLSNMAALHTEGTTTADTEGDSRDLRVL